MKRMSLQWRLTCIITVYIAVICGCLTMFVYKNGVYYIDSLQETVDAQGEDNGEDTDEIYISIPDDKWDEFANDFSIQAYNNKEDYKKNSLLISAILALIGGVVTYFISGHALRDGFSYQGTFRAGAQDQSVNFLIKLKKYRRKIWQLHE